MEFSFAEPFEDPEHFSALMLDTVPDLWWLECRECIRNIHEVLMNVY